MSSVCVCVRFRWRPPSSLSAKAPETPATSTTTKKKKSGSLSQRNVERSLLNSRSGSGSGGAEERWRELNVGQQRKSEENIFQGGLMRDWTEPVYGNNDNNNKNSSVEPSHSDEGRRTDSPKRAPAVLPFQILHHLLLIHFHLFSLVW